MVTHKNDDPKHVHTLAKGKLSQGQPEDIIACPKGRELTQGYIQKYWLLTKGEFEGCQSQEVSSDGVPV